MPSIAPHRAHYAKPWRARIKVRTKERFLGYFATKEEAAEAENEFRRKLRLKERDGRFVL